MEREPEFIADQVAYRRRFGRANGPGPWACHFCGEPVIDGNPEGFNARSFVVHHIDGDHTNDADANLSAAHNDCHARYHSKKRWARAKERGESSLGALTEEGRERRREGGKIGGRRTAEMLASDPEFRERRRHEQSAHLADPDQQRRMREGRERWLAGLDPDERQRCTSRYGVTHSPEVRKKISEGMRRASRRRYRCGGCDRVSTAGGIGNHQASTGHEGRVRVA